mmetsp:Transcript_49391/g.147507  ORF Transcript_49391/g.147507 Transcript_49391/m.147507 type:complete len:236 (-) Transcript_49391:177-884(-)
MARACPRAARATPRRRPRAKPTGRPISQGPGGCGSRHAPGKWPRRQHRRCQSRVRRGPAPPGCCGWQPCAHGRGAPRCSTLAAPPTRRPGCHQPSSRAPPRRPLKAGQGWNCCRSRGGCLVKPLPGCYLARRGNHQRQRPSAEAPPARAAGGPSCPRGSAASSCAARRRQPCARGPQRPQVRRRPRRTGPSSGSRGASGPGGSPGGSGARPPPVRPPQYICRVLRSKGSAQAHAP